MISVPTTLVLGAGASVEFGYPAGKKLNEIIADKLLLEGENYPLKNDERKAKHDAELIYLLTELGFDQEEISDFADKLSRSGASSIDNFIEDSRKERPNYYNLGRAIVAYVLTSFENKKQLRHRQNNWYQRLVNDMSRDCEFHTFFTQNRSLNIVTFNYDLSIEEYFFETLQNKYVKPWEETAELMKSIKIIHVHGTLCRPHWWTPKKAKSDAGYAYGDKERLDEEWIKKSMEGIVIPTVDKRSPVELLEEARALLYRSKRVIFLGFGYDDRNLQKLEIYSGNDLESHKNELFGYGYVTEKTIKQHEEEWERKSLVIGSCTGIADIVRERIENNYSKYGLKLIGSSGASDFLASNVDLTTNHV